jgi:hypothetical protein
MKTEHVDADGRTVVRDDGEDRERIPGDKDLRDAYDRGRADEAVRHKRNWLMTILGTLLALFGLIVLVLAALNGSFARGGAVLDRQLSIAVDQAEPAARNAASTVAGEIREARTDETEPDPLLVQTPTGPVPATNTIVTDSTTVVEVQ